MFPKQKEIEIPLLEALVQLGGQARPKEVYPLVTRRFPQLREEDLTATLQSGVSKWTNRVQWARQTLVEKGEIDSPAHGIWRITAQGRRRVAEASLPQTEPDLPTFLELYDGYEAAFRAQMLEKPQNLSPREFEYFSRRVLDAYGFVDATVTAVGRDGGIDGHGKLKLGLATMRAAFQCKKWQGNVSRTEVDKFRGAIQGAYEQGVFFTTSDFTSEARDASLRRGAAPIILLNGESIVDLMIDKGLGVQKVPLYAYYERASDFAELEED